MKIILEINDDMPMEEYNKMLTDIVIACKPHLFNIKTKM